MAETKNVKEVVLEERTVPVEEKEYMGLVSAKIFLSTLMQCGLEQTECFKEAEQLMAEGILALAKKHGVSEEEMLELEKESN